MMRLPEDLERQWIAQVEQMEAERQMQYVSSAERLAMQKGHEEGREEGATRLLLRLLTHRFGEVPEAVQKRLSTLTLEQTEALVDKALTSQNLATFTQHLPAASETSTSD